MSRVENKMSRVEGKMSRVQKCVEVSFPAFFELIERPRCQCKRFPSSALFAHTPFSFARVIVNL